MPHRLAPASLLLWMATGTAVAQVVPSASSSGTVTTAAGAINYTTTWSEIALNDTIGQPQATLSTISYVRKQADSGRRPVVFVFNGGPGASSVTLNYGLFGPESRIISAPATGGEPADTQPDGTALPTRFVPNPDTLLDLADLVMIDPVGTGFSRELRPGGGSTYWTTQGDLDSIEHAIRTWLTANGRDGSPIYLAGESYAGFRIGFLASALADRNVAGLILISPGIDLTNTISGDLMHAANVPSMAVAAVRHGRVSAGGRSIDAIYADAETFASGPYLSALHRGTALAQSERLRIARQLSKLIGLSDDMIVKADLRVDTQSFLENLVAGKVMGRLDDRVLGDAPSRRNPARDAAADDPSLGLAGGTVRRSAPVAEHLRQMGVKAPGDYIALTLDVNFRWDWRPRSPSWDANLSLDATPAYVQFLTKRPQARIIAASGYYDLAIPLGMTHYSLTRAGIPPDRVTFREYESGHTISDDPHARAALVRDLRSFIAASGAQ